MLVPVILEGTGKPPCTVKVLDDCLHRGTPDLGKVRRGLRHACVLVVSGCGSRGGVVQERVSPVPGLFLTPPVEEEDRQRDGS